MVIVESVVRLLVKNLGDVIIQEAFFSYGVRDQLQLMEDEFRRMQCFLKDANDKQEGDERVKKWVQDVVIIAYDAENAIDTFIFKMALLRQGGFMGTVKRYALTFNKFIALHKLGSEIERIKIKIRSISESRLTYGIENIGRVGASSAGQSLQEWRIPSPHVQEPDLVGFEKDAETIVVWLTEGELRLSVVSVVGMGGLGKTTLVKKVYNSDRVRKHFNSHAWISISQEYAVRDLLQNIINSYMVLSEEELKKVEKMNLAQLRYKIFEHLKQKRYLLVLDDIWKNEAWDALKDALPDMNNGSRVLLTTCNKDVALHADVRSQPYELQFLNDEDGWELFCKKTFPGRDGGCPQDLEEVGREIVEKCHCLPLAIVVIKGLLSRKEPREWKNVRKSISWQFVKGEVKISAILSLSYKDLPYYLKPCFLYLGNFPEDHEFRAKELVQMWAAEGLLPERGEETLEEVGEDCLKELIQRSIVQVARRSSSGGFKTCVIHDLLRDLSISEAKESMFLEVHHGNANAPSASRARRLAIHHNDLSRYISLSSSPPHLRSVLIYTQGSMQLQREQERFLYRGFKLLRVLYLHSAQIYKLPREIGELIHLRYLRCTYTSLKSLPSSIGNLSNLQTLFLESFDDIKVPSTIGRMQQLRHLQLKTVKKLNNSRGIGHWGVIEGHPRLERISNLQTLTHVIAGEWMQGCLGKLTNLRKLGIGLFKRADAEVLYKLIANLDCLHSLSIVVELYLIENVALLVPPVSHLVKLCKLHLHGKLEKLPESTEFPRNLIKLSLAYSFLKQDPLATLEKLENLRILRLLYYSFIGVGVVCSAQGFPRLESLHLHGLLQLEEWRVEEGAMPSLLHLRIHACPQLQMLPEGLQQVTTLKKLELRYMPDEFRERLREDEGEDWHKIQHIPSIDVGHY